LVKPQNPVDSAPPTTLSNFRSRRKQHKRKLQGSDFCSGKWDFPTQKSPRPRRTCRRGRLKARKGFGPLALSGGFNSLKRALSAKSSGQSVFLGAKAAHISVRA